MITVDIGYSLSWRDRISAQPDWKLCLAQKIMTAKGGGPNATLPLPNYYDGRLGKKEPHLYIIFSLAFNIHL